MSGPHVQWEERWTCVQEGITKVLMILEGVPNQELSSEEYMKTITAIYVMCNQRVGSNRLYNKFKSVFEDYLHSKVLPAVQDQSNELLLRELVSKWETYMVMVQKLSITFSYLDGHIQRRWLHGLKELAVTRFQDRVLPNIDDKAVKDTIFTLIRKERDGEQIERALLKHVIDIYTAKGIEPRDGYAQDLETRFIEETSAYYSRKASSWIVEDTCPQYMLRAEECLKEENERVSYYLNQCTQIQVIKKVKDELLVVHANQLLEKEDTGFVALLRDEKVKELSRMHTLYCDIFQGLKLLAKLLRQHIGDQGTVILQQAEEAATNEASRACGVWEEVFLTKMIELHNKYMPLVTNCFREHHDLLEALREGIEIICSEAVAGSSGLQLIAMICDNLIMMSGNEELSDDSIDKTLEKAVELVSYMGDNKYLCTEWYRKKLGSRLLHGGTFKKDFELNMFTKINQVTRGLFTSEIQGMIADFSMAEETQRNFVEYLRNNPAANLGMDLTVSVLTVRFWPPYKSSDFNLPEDMIKCVEAFEAYYYTTQRRGRLLTWNHSLGYCHVEGKFEQKTMKLIVSTHQAVALLLFNDADRLSYSEIITKLNMSHEDVVEVLHSLSCSEYKILTKEPGTEFISDTDNFEFNYKFTDQKNRIKILLPPEYKKGNVTTNSDTDRCLTIDAALVRIMKRKKVLRSQPLLDECTEALNHIILRPDVTIIKNRIEHLIKEEYLERDPHNQDILWYCP